MALWCVRITCHVSLCVLRLAQLLQETLEDYKVRRRIGKRFAEHLTTEEGSAATPFPQLPEPGPAAGLAQPSPSNLQQEEQTSPWQRAKCFSGQVAVQEQLVQDLAQPWPGMMNTFAGSSPPELLNAARLPLQTDQCLDPLQNVVCKKRRTHEPSSPSSSPQESDPPAVGREHSLQMVQRGGGVATPPVRQSAPCAVVSTLSIPLPLL